MLPPKGGREVALLRFKGSDHLLRVVFLAVFATVIVVIGKGELIQFCPPHRNPHDVSGVTLRGAFLQDRLEVLVQTGGDLAEARVVNGVLDGRCDGFCNRLDAGLSR